VCGAAVRACGGAAHAHGPEPGAAPRAWAQAQKLVRAASYFFFLNTQDQRLIFEFRLLKTQAQRLTFEFRLLGPEVRDRRNGRGQGRQCLSLLCSVTGRRAPTLVRSPLLAHPDPFPSVCHPPTWSSVFLPAAGPRHQQLGTCPLPLAAPALRPPPPRCQASSSAAPRARSRRCTGRAHGDPESESCEQLRRLQSAVRFAAALNPKQKITDL